MVSGKLRLAVGLVSSRAEIDSHEVVELDGDDGMSRYELKDPPSRTSLSTLGLDSPVLTMTSLGPLRRSLTLRE